MAEKIGEDWTLSPHKRALDLIGITALMPLFVPGSAAIAAAIQHSDGMNPIFKQTRYGLGFEPFTFYKFQTMPPGTPETASEGSNDSRRTQLGARLSSKHLDEMPQTLNIYNGTMSMVGPRPLIMQDVVETLDVLSPSEQKLWIYSRYTTKPAVFGKFQLSQHTNGYSPESSDDWVRTRALLDIEYAETASFRGDMDIILATARAAYNTVRNGTSEEEHLRGESGAAMFHAVAEGFGVQVTDEEHECWRATLLAARCLDNLVDEQDPALLEWSVAELLRGQPVAGMTGKEAEAFRDMYLQQVPHRQQLLINTFLALTGFADKRLKSHSLRQVVEINLAEAEMFGDILYLDPYDNNRIRFNKWLRLFAKTGYLADTVLDARKDFASGHLGVKPTLSERSGLGLRALADSGRLLVNAPTKSYGLLARGVLKTLFTNVLQQ
ncbi:MAG: sugar transferase [Patescibacteria group bacterium]